MEIARKYINKKLFLAFIFKCNENKTKLAVHLIQDLLEDFVHQVVHVMVD